MRDKLLPSVAILSSFLEQSSALWNRYGDNPAPNSQADLELTNFLRRESVATAYSQAGMLFESAADYCMALVKTLTEPMQSIAPWGNARSVVEMSAMATWLWDKKINAYQRVQRSLVFWHTGIVGKLDFAKKSTGFLDTDEISERLKYIENIALELGIGRKNKKKFIFKEEMPTITKIVGDMLDKENEYRLLSAMVHGRNWALQSFGFKVTTEPQNIYQDLEGVYITNNLDEELVNYLGISAFTSLATPILNEFRLFGWDAKPMAILIQRTQNEFGKIQER